MEFGMELDVADLPASLRRWDSSIYDDGLLKVPSFDDIQTAWKIKHAAFSLEDNDESSSGLSLSSSHSNASSTLNAGADLGLNFDFEIFDDLSAQTRTPVDSSPGSPSLTSIPAPTGLRLGKLNLKLNHGAVAASWQAIAGDAPVFAMSACDVVTAAVGIPSAAAVAASLAVGSQDGWAASGLDDFVPVRAPKPDPRPAAPRPPMAPRPPAPRPPRKSSSKRRGGSKASDKRPRIKGRFVTREELEHYQVTRDNGPAAAADAEDAEMALVPDTDLASFFDHEAPAVW